MCLTFAAAVLPATGNSIACSSSAAPKICIDVKNRRSVLWFSKDIFHIQEKVLKKKPIKYNPGRERQVMSEEGRVNV